MKIPQFYLPAGTVLAVIVGVLCYRQAQLWGVPDIGHPFEVEKLGRIEIPPDENASPDYELAVKMLVPHREFEDNVDESEEFWKPWSEMHPILKDWLDDNSETLDVWLRGTEKKHCLEYQPIDRKMEYIVGPISEIRNLVRLASLSAKRAESKKKYEEAWNLYRAIFRYSFHLSQYGTSIEKTVSASIHSQAVTGTLRWSGFEGVSESRLQKAITNLRNDRRMVGKRSESVVAHYFITLDLLDRMDEMRKAANRVADDMSVLTAGYNTGVDFDSVRYPDPITIFISNEPELTRRLLQHQVVNLLGYADLPLCEQPQLIESEVAYFQVDNGDEVRLSAEEFKKAVDRSPLADKILLSGPGPINSIRREEARHAMLECILAAQWYRRVHAEFPESLDQLVDEGMLTEIPNDPMSWECEPIRYEHDPREKERAKIWSVGENRGDDGGAFDHIPGFGQLDLGYIIGREILDGDTPTQQDPEIDGTEPAAQSDRAISLPALEKQTR